MLKFFFIAQPVAPRRPFFMTARLFMGSIRLDANHKNKKETATNSTVETIIHQGPCVTYLIGPLTFAVTDRSEISLTRDSPVMICVKNSVRYTTGFSNSGRYAFSP